MDLRRLLILLAGIAAIILAAVVLVAHPANTIDLLAGVGLAAGAGLVVSAL